MTSRTTKTLLVAGAAIAAISMAACQKKDTAAADAANAAQ